MLVSGKGYPSKILLGYVGDFAMYKHILLPTDGSELSKMAIREGIDLAKALGARVTVVTVTTPFHILSGDPTVIAYTSEQYKKHTVALAGQHIDVAKKIAAVAGVPCEALHVEHEHPYQAIIDTAQNRGCDAILMASHGRRGMSAIVLGSETLKVLTHSIIPVIVYRQPRAGIAQLLAAS
jgi:nucleotide-binding universal stress UspA family protein